MRNARGRGVVRGVTLVRLSGILAVIAAATVGADDRKSMPANLDLVRVVAREAVAKLVAGIEPVGKRVRVQIEPFHETAWLVQDLAAEALRAQGFEVVKSRVTAAAPAAGAAAAPAGADTARAPADSAAAGADSTQAPVDSTQASADTTHAGTAQAGTTPAGSAHSGPLGQGNPAPGSAQGSAAQGLEDAADLGPPVDAELDLRVVELGLRYTGAHSRFLFFGGRSVERYAAARLHGELRRHGDPAVLWSGDGEASAIDEVPESALSILEGQQYPFTAPALPAGRASRVIEPVIVSVIVVGLVFLFVSNRS